MHGDGSYFVNSFPTKVSPRGPATKQASRRRGTPLTPVLAPQGCFSKNGRAYFGSGWTIEQMASPDLPGVQERIWFGPVATAGHRGNRGRAICPP